MLDFLHHLFVPHAGNNHRSKLLHNSSLFIILVFFIIISLFTFFVKNVNPEILGISYSISDSELLTLVNRERIDRGLPTLTMNAELSDAARRKAADMLAKNYWAHFAPDGSTSPWGFIKESGYSYVFAGENLAKGFTDANSTVVAWMNSASHRDNILSDKYRDVGFAIVPGTINGEETVLVVEMFGSRTSQTLATTKTAAAAATPTPAPISPQPITRVASLSDGGDIPSPTPVITRVEQAVSSSPKIDSRVTSKAASTIGLSFLAFAFVMDLLIVERKKIPRVVGHNLDHLMLILLFLLFIVLRGSGVVL